MKGVRLRRETSLMAAGTLAAALALAGCASGGPGASPGPVSSSAAVSGPAQPSPSASESRSAARRPGRRSSLAEVHDPGQVTGTLAGPCQARDDGRLPDRHCTPGVVDPAVTQADIGSTICVSGYTQTVRPPESQTGKFKFGQAYPAYGLASGTADRHGHWHHQDQPRRTGRSAPKPHYRDHPQPARGDGVPAAPQQLRRRLPKLAQRLPRGRRAGREPDRSPRVRHLAVAAEDPPSPRRQTETYSTLQYAKTRIRSAHRFLAWLGQRNACLAAATQADVDEFLSLHGQLAGTLQPFLRWATQTCNCRSLGCRPERRDQPKPAITADKRWQLLRRLLHDDSLDSADRVMGAIILTYAASLTKVLSIQIDDVDVIGNDGTGIEVSLALGSTEVRLPPILDQLLVQHLRRNRLPANGSAIGTSMWLFPGTKAGQPLSHARAVVRLRQLGLHPGPGRSRALLHLASRVEAPLLAQALGIHPSTAVRWSELAGRPFSGYVVRQTRGPTTPQHRR